mgnify:CR=1 FL=1
MRAFSGECLLAKLGSATLGTFGGAEASGAGPWWVLRRPGRVRGPWPVARADISRTRTPRRLKEIPKVESGSTIAGSIVPSLRLHYNEIAPNSYQIYDEI